jgi:phospholipid/cholesterol/gamma-HCH transport system substrate-binding protein
MTILERLDARTLGLIGIVVTTVLGLAVAAISFVPFGQRDVTAIVEHSAGLRVGEEVQVAGVGSGEVRDIHLDGRQVRVDFTIDDDVRLGNGTTASIKVATLLGSHFLEVSPAGTGGLKDDTIPLSRTTVPFNLQDVVEGSTKTLDELDGVTMSKSFQVLADALRGTPDDARAAIDGVSHLSAVAARRTDQLGALLSASRQVTGDLARNSAEIIDLLRQSNLVLQELTKRRDVIRAMLVDARRLAHEVSGVLADNEKQLDPLMKDFSAALANLRQHEQKLTDSIDGLGTMSRYFANAAGNGPWIDLHIPVGLPDNLTCGTNCGDH